MAGIRSPTSTRRRDVVKRSTFVSRDTWRSCALILLIIGGTAVPLIVQPGVRAQSSPRIVVDLALGSLKTVQAPEPANLNEFLRVDDSGTVSPEARRAAIVLGKALFWDQAVGSEGVDAEGRPIGQACGSCHFNAFADSRSRNQLNPGFRAVPPDTTFSPPFGVNYQLTAGDFPFFKLSDPNSRPSAIIFDTNDSASSQGVSRQRFVDIVLGGVADSGSPEASIFNAVGARDVEPRNTPTVINAVFNHRNLWDGRARNEFNGVNPLGDLDPFARVLMASGPHRQLRKVSLAGSLRLEDASLASQAVGPPLNDSEMSFDGRTFPKLGKKMLSLRRALPGQLVAPDDSVLGDLTAFPEPGLRTDYDDLIKAAFQPQWWNSNAVITFAADCPDGASAGGTDPDLCFAHPPHVAPPLTTSQFTQMEYNSSLFWGIAVQMYEATLRADDSPFDRFAAGNTSALTADQLAGLQIFQGQGRCIACHSGPEFTNASVQNVRNATLERMIMGDDQVAVYDNGFYNSAVTGCGPGRCDDIGIGATIGPLNLPLSNSRLFQAQC